MALPASPSTPLPTRELRIGGRLTTYRLRRSPRSRGLRVTVDPRAGLVVSVPPASRRGWERPEARIEAFLDERAAWVHRHLDRWARDRATARERGGARDGGLVPYRGLLHRIRVQRGSIAGRRSRVERIGGDEEDELVVSLARGERRALQRILEAWFRDRAKEAVDAAVAIHAPALGIRPARVDLRDPRSRWGSASRAGRLMLSWRLVLAPPACLETVVVHELAHLRILGHGPGFWALVAGRRPNHLADRAWLRRNAPALHAALDPDEAAEGPR